MKKYLNYFFEILTATLVFYIAACFLISFQSVLKVFVLVINSALIVNFYENLSHKYGKKQSLVLLAISIAILNLLIYFVGYFEVAETISKLK